MMFTELDPLKYKLNGVFFNAEFEELLSKVIACYNLMIIDNVTMPNNENSIRDVLLIHYLKNNKIRKQVGLFDYIFDREVPEDTTVGRTDIKIQTSNTFVDTTAYYTIECKRLDAIAPNGKSGLNAKYIENGIQRFVLKTYASHYQTNGLIGFIVEDLDIHVNIQSIRTLLTTEFKRIKTIQNLKQKTIANGFVYSYYSSHESKKKILTIYHLMFDFSKNVR